MEIEPKEVESYRWVSFEQFTHHFHEISKPISIEFPDFLAK